MPPFKNFGLILWREGQDCLVLTGRNTAAFTVVPFFICGFHLCLTFWTRKWREWESIIFYVRLWCVLSFSLSSIVVLSWCWILILLLTDALYLTGLFTFVGLKFLARYTDNFDLDLSVEGHRDNSVCLLCAGSGYQWNKQRMDLYKPGQLNPDKMKVNYSTGRLSNNQKGWKRLYWNGYILRSE